MYRIHSRRCLSACIEQVELRRLLATLVGNQLNIEGTAGDDRIRVETIGGNVVVTTNNTPQSFDKNLVRTVVANLRSGNDRIDIVWNVNAPTTISGEAGNDTVVGGSYSDFIFTGSGNDAVYGSAGNDLIETSIGDDFVAPGFGNDTIDTGAGNDRVSYDDRSSPITASLVANYRVSTSNPTTMELVSDGKMVAGSETDAYAGAETLIAGGGNDTLTLRGATVASSTPIPVLYEIRGGAGNDKLTLRFLRPGEETATRGTATRLSPMETPVAFNAPAALRAPAITATQMSRTPLAADGGAGNDSIVGSEGDDVIRPGVGNDTVDGGAGNDEVSYSDRSTSITGTLVANVVQEVFGAAPRQWIDGSVQAGSESDQLANTETLTGGSGNDQLNLTLGSFIPYLGNTLAARLNGGEGNDSFNFRGGYQGSAYYGITATADAGAGNDLFSYQYPTWLLTLYGGDGNDTIGSNDDDIYSPNFIPGAGIDYFDYQGLELNYTMPAGLENVRIIGDIGYVRVIGNDLPNTIEVWGNTYAYVEGRGGNDRITRLNPSHPSPTTLLGGEGNDTLTGGDGADLIDGGAGNDSIDGLGGDDTLLPGTGNDTIDAGLGQDVVSYADRSTGIRGNFDATVRYATDPSQGPYGFAWWSTTASVTSGTESDTVVNLEVLTGSQADDVLRFKTYDIGGTIPSALQSQAFRLNGGGGSDGMDALMESDTYPDRHAALTLDGGEGNDRIGGYAVFAAIGGSGDDYFQAVGDDATAPTIDAGPGVDTFEFTRIGPTYRMPDGLENLIIAHTQGEYIYVEGNDLANTIRAKASGGTVYIDGRGGNDLIILEQALSIALTTLLGGDGNDTILGNDSADLINGGAGDDSIDGFGGIDSIYGGTGTDTAKRDDADAIVDSIEVVV